jgi:hypothetical protein
MEYGTILVATAEPEEALMILLSDDLATHEDWTALVLSGPSIGRIVWVPEEVLRDDPAYMEVSR